MAWKTLWKANIKKQKGSLLGIFLLLFLVSLCLGAVLTLWVNGNQYIEQEIKRAGFGNLTAWVADVPDIHALAEEIAALKEVEKIEVQRILYGDYEINGQESDSEGQWMASDQEENRYRFFVEDLKGYLEVMPKIQPGEVYVSPSLISIFDAKIGDEVCLRVARAGGDKVFTIKGFYEDPFMGSSMIGMKGFLISKEDYEEIIPAIQEAGINALARDGAMLHITGTSIPNVDRKSIMTTKGKLEYFDDGSETEVIDGNISLLNQIINTRTSLSEYTEFVHSEHSIAGFMLVLQNAFSGFLLAFAIVLFLVSMVSISHSLDSGLEAERTNMGILKTIGFTNGMLRRTFVMQYVIFIVGGILIGAIFALPISNGLSKATVTTTGILIPVSLPLKWCLLTYGAILLFLTIFISIKTETICRITPMMAIRRELSEIDARYKGVSTLIPINGNYLHISLAFRQLMAGKRQFVGACITAMLLVFFASLVGRMDTWLGSDGKGMMDAFNPADHDLGIQTFGKLTTEEAEKRMMEFTDIIDHYVLAMPGVSVNGVDHTANVIDQPERFHIMEGKSCFSEDEIVVTEFVAADLGISVGDIVTVGGNLNRKEYRISGIYQCANDMGVNIGMSREGYVRIGQDDPQLWCHHYFLSHPERKGEIIEALEAAYGGDIHIHENSWPGLLGIIAAMKALLVVMYLLVAVFTLVVTVLTGSRILLEEQKDMAIYQAMGFSPKWLRITFALRFGMTALVGSFVGSGIAIVGTDPLVSAVMKLAGISNFASKSEVGNICFPLAVVVGLFTGFAYLSARKIETRDLTVLIQE